MTLTDKIITYGSVFSPMIPLLFCWKKKLSRYQIVIILFITFSFTSDLYCTFLHRWIFGHSVNTPFLHAYGLIEALILIYFYSLILKPINKWLLPVAIIFSLAYLLDSFYLEYGGFNAYGRSLECVLIITFSLMLFFEFYNNEVDIFIDRSPLFWINVALITYFSGALFSFLLSKKILSGPLPWVPHNISNILKNIILGVAVWRIKPER
jgi:hypothetical protein